MLSSGASGDCLAIQGLLCVLISGGLQQGSMWIPFSSQLLVRACYVFHAAFKFPFYFFHHFLWVWWMTTPSSSYAPLAIVSNSKFCTFKDVLVVSSASSPSFQFIHTSFKGFHALIIIYSVVSQLASSFTLTLVGKFVLRRRNLNVICKFFMNLKFSSFFHIGLLYPCHVAIQLSNNLDYNWITLPLS